MRSTSQPTPTDLPSDRDSAFRLLFADHPLPMWIYDLATLQLLDVNAAALVHYGYSRAEFLQLRISDLYPPSAVPEQAGFARHRTRDGQIISVEILSRPLTFDGRAAQLVCAIDIGERLAAQAAQRASDERLASVIASAMDAVISIDAEQRIILFNHAAETMFHCRADQVLGQPIDRFIPERFRAAHRDHIRRFGATGITSRSMGQLHPIGGVRADGEEFPIEASISQVGSGDQKIYTVILRDITARQQAETALRESHARLQKVLEVETVGVMFWDLATGQMTDANDAFLNMMGYSRRDVEARELTWQKLTPPEYIEVSLAEVRKFQVTGRVGPYEKEYFRKDGTRQWLVFAGSSLGGNTCVEFCVDIADRKRAEQALRESQERLNRLIDSNVIGVAVAGAGGEIFEANDYYLNLLGVTRSELDAGQVRWIDRTPPEHLPADARALAQLQQTGVCEPYEKEYYRADGSRVWVLITDAMLLHEEAKIIALAQDISDRKRTEAVLRESEAWFRATFEQAAIGIESLDLDGHYLRGNAALNRMLGYTEAELQQRRFSEITHPDDLRREEPLLADLLAGRISSYTIEKRYIRRDGQPVWVRVISSLVEGATTYRIAIIENITERKLAEDQLAFQAHLLANVSDAILATDTQFRITAWNAAAERMYGWTAAEVLGHNALELLRTQYEPGNDRASLLKRLAEDSTVRVEVTQQRKDGTRLPVESSTIVLHDDTGHVTGYASVIRDISERKQAEAQIRQLNQDLERRVVERTAQLEASNRELEAFSYSVSHDLRAPLRAIDGFARILTRKAQGTLPPELQRYLDLIRDNAQRMGTLIDDLLTFSRLGRQPLIKQRVDMNQLARSALSELQAEQAGRRVDVKLDLLNDCQGDPALLKQVWLNLLSNALKYTRRSDPATIELTATTTGTEIRYSVADNGVGFDMQYADKLFGVFQRFHRQEDYEGTGVGLAIVHRIITRHGGRIWAQAAPGSGATFTFALERPSD